MLSGLAREVVCLSQVTVGLPPSQSDSWAIQTKLYMDGKKAIMGLDYIKGKSKKPWIKLNRGTQRNSEKNEYICQ